MAVTMMTAVVVGVVQATVIPAFLSIFQERYDLKVVVAISLLSGALYLVPTIGATLSYVSILGLLFWHLRPGNLFIDVLVPVGTARLLSIPIMMLLSLT